MNVKSPNMDLKQGLSYLEREGEGDPGGRGTEKKRARQRHRKRE
jgi:hypothetical protein